MKNFGKAAPNSDRRASDVQYFYSFFITRAGTPPTRVFAGTSFVTTAPAAITELSPTVTPLVITALDPMK